MTDIVFVFEVHQPHRLRENFFWENKFFKRVDNKDLFNYYFNYSLNKGIFEKASKKCYFPSNQILLNLIDKYRRERKQIKVSFSISGIFLEQCEMFNRDVLESFKQLAETGCVEFLNQTYYHSLASLYPIREEFITQVKMHQQIIKDLFGFHAKVFENTELLYNNAIAEIIENLGYEGIITEGMERILLEKSPHHLYTPKKCDKIKILLRDYKVTDDIGFRFSARWWNEWPLTADKYASWLAKTPGEYICIFPDYETFGEHHWPETGIHEFLKGLPEEILRWDHLSMSTPSEVVEKYSSSGEIDVPELSGTVSWADMERDTSCWLGNTQQWAYYSSVKRLEQILKGAVCEELLRIWRYFQISDHLYYMFTGGGGPGTVHSYFRPFSSPIDAFITAFSAILDFENRVRLAIGAADEPFYFCTEAGEKLFPEKIAWNLTSFTKILKDVIIESIEFHTRRSDFERWIRLSLHDSQLAERFGKIRSLNLKGEKLRKSIVKMVEEHLSQKTKKVLKTQ